MPFDRPSVNLSAAIRIYVHRLVRLVFRRLPADFVVPMLQSRLLGRRWFRGAGPNSYWLGTFERPKQILLERLVRPGDVFFDIGAHVGFYSLLASALVGSTGKVFAFEPNPRNVRYLRAHVAMNHLTNVALFEAAVWDRPGTVLFETAGDSSTSRVAETGSLQVAATTLDGLRAEGALPAPNFIKIDVEGGEIHVLRGAIKLLKETSPLVILSTHGPQPHDECCALLRSLGFELRPLLPGSDLETASEIIARRPFSSR